MAIELTESARKKLKEILSGDEWREKNPYLRLGVVGGGCSGYTYKPLELCDESQNPIEKTDRIFPFPEIKVVVDAKSYLILNGSVLDYRSDPLNSGFFFENPNAQHSCGCGQSFSTDKTT